MTSVSHIITISVYDSDTVTVTVSDSQSLSQWHWVIDIDWLRNNYQLISNRVYTIPHAV